jgi:hypothetical protein
MAQSAEKGWYVRGDIDDWRARDLWLFENQTATRMLVTNPENGPGTFFKAEPGDDFLACIRRHTPSWLEPGAPGFHSMTLGPGEYHPRIARPLALASLELRRELWLPPSVLAEKAYFRERERPTYLAQAQARNHLPDRAALRKDPGRRLRPRDPKSADPGGNRSRDALARDFDRKWRVCAS